MHIDRGAVLLTAVTFLAGTLKWRLQPAEEYWNCLKLVAFTKFILGDRIKDMKDSAGFLNEINVVENLSQQGTEAYITIKKMWN